MFGDQSKRMDVGRAFVRLATAALVAASVGMISKSIAAEPVQIHTDMAALEKAAKAEGTLNIYTAVEYDFLITGFKKAYPWATVNYTALAPAETAAKIQVELGAGVHNADIANLKVPQVQQFITNQGLARIVVPNDALVPDALKDPDGYTHPETSSYIALVYNTDLVKKPPANLADLVNPEWRDKFAIDVANGSAGSQVLMMPRAVMGDEKWKQWLQALAKNQPNITKSNSVSFDNVLRGDSAICACTYHDYTNRHANAPLGAVLYDQGGQGIATALTVAVAMKNAPHPNMAALWLNWMESPQGGQPAFAASGRAPVVEFPGNEAGLPSGTKVAPIWKDLGEYFKNPNPFDATISSILKRG